MKVQLFEKGSAKSLENEINNFLSKCKPEDVIEIQYKPVRDSEYTMTHIAMIILKQERCYALVYQHYK